MVYIYLILKKKKNFIRYKNKIIGQIISNKLSFYINNIFLQKFQNLL